MSVPNLNSKETKTIPKKPQTNSSMKRIKIADYKPTFFRSNINMGVLDVSRFKFLTVRI